MRSRFQCNGKLDCADGEDEWFCDLQINGPTITPLDIMKFSLYPIDLQNISTQPVHHIEAYALMSSYAESSWYCNRGVSITDSGLRRCLCPSSYSGERCENQRERISVILQIISSPSLQRDIAIKDTAG